MTVVLTSIQQRVGRAVAWCGRHGRIVRNEDGGSLIEFALVTTVMMTFILIVMQLCLALYSFGMICESAREATRWAATRGSACQTPSLTSCATDQAHVSAYAKALGLPNIGGGTLNVTTTFPDSDPVPPNSANCQKASVCRVKVVITYVVPITMPLVPKNSISLTTQSQMFFVQ